MSTYFDPSDYDYSPWRVTDPEPLTLTPWICELIKSLPEGDQEAVNLVYAKHLTYQEAASQLGIPLGSFKVRMRRAHRLIASDAHLYYVVEAANHGTEREHSAGTWEAIQLYRCELAGFHPAGIPGIFRSLGTRKGDITDIHINEEADKASPRFSLTPAA